MTAIESTATGLAQAQAKAAKVAEALSAAEGAKKIVQDRIAALEAERAQIIADRKEGADDYSHGPRLAVIAADLEGLREILAEVEAAIGPVKAEADAASAAVAQAQHLLERAEEDALLARLVDHAKVLDRLLHDTVTRINRIAQRRSMRDPWAPSRALANELRKLDLRNGGF